MSPPSLAAARPGLRRLRTGVGASALLRWGIMMNRQLRRAQEKQDKKADKEKQRRRAARRSRVDSLRAQRAQRKSAPVKGEDKGSTGSTGGRGRNPGRFSGALLIATIFFIALNAAVPRPEAEAGGGFLSSPMAFSVIGALYYGLFGYFAVLWMKRRGIDRPLWLALASGAMLAIGGEAAKLFQGGYSPDLPYLLLIPPALVLGVLAGRWVHDHA